MIPELLSKHDEISLECVADENGQFWWRTECDAEGVALLRSLEKEVGPHIEGLKGRPDTIQLRTEVGPGEFLGIVTEWLGTPRAESLGVVSLTCHWGESTLFVKMPPEHKPTTPLFEAEKI